MVKNFLFSPFLIAFLLNLALESLGSFPTQAQSLRLTSGISVHSSLNFLAQQTPNAGSEKRSFFETGRLRSQDRLLFQRPPSDVSPIRTQSNSWQFVIFREGNSSFWGSVAIFFRDRKVLTFPLFRQPFQRGTQ